MNALYNLRSHLLKQNSTSNTLHKDLRHTGKEIENLNSVLNSIPNLFSDYETGHFECFFNDPSLR